MEHLFWLAMRLGQRLTHLSKSQLGARRIDDRGVISGKF
jgi:hypothetical protein